MQYRLIVFSLFVLTFGACSVHTAARKQSPQRASALIYQYLNIDKSKELTDEAIQDAVFKLVPQGASMEKIFELFEKTGLGPSHCAPGEYDETPFAGMPYCEFRSSEKTCGEKYVNYNIHFVMKNNPSQMQLEPGDTLGFREVKVNRWIRECRK